MKSQIRYFEDYQVGQKGTTQTRTVTDTDIVNFAHISGDYFMLHMDRHYAAETIFGRRIAHGQLGLSLVTGMLSFIAPHVVGRGVPGAYFQGFDMNFRAAIRLGDTVKISWSIVEKTDAPAYQGFGLVKTACQVVNQDGGLAYEGNLTTLARKASAKDARLELKPGTPWNYRSFIPNPQQIYWLEDLPVDMGRESEGRTITEADIIRFAALTGEYNPQYVDADFARQSQFGERLAPGMLIFSISNGLRGNDSGRYQQPKSTIAGFLNNQSSFLAPVKIGDTVHCLYKVIGNRVSKSKPELGIVTYGMQVINQRNEVVQESAVSLLVPSRAKPPR